MSAVIEVNNPQNWELIYEASLAAERDPTNSIKFLPIPRLIIPVTTAVPVLAVECSSIDALPHWVLAFYLTTSISIPSLGKADIGSYPQLLGLNLYTVKAGYEEYFYRVSFPIWHKSMDIKLYKYLGIYNPCEFDGGEVE